MCTCHKRRTELNPLWIWSASCDDCAVDTTTQSSNEWYWMESCPSSIGRTTSGHARRNESPSKLNKSWRAIWDKQSCKLTLCFINTWGNNDNARRLNGRETAGYVSGGPDQHSDYVFHDSLNFFPPTRPWVISVFAPFVWGVMIRSLQSPNICCSFDADLVAVDKIPGTGLRVQRASTCWSRTSLILSGRPLIAVTVQYREEIACERSVKMNVKRMDREERVYIPNR